MTNHNSFLITFMANANFLSRCLKLDVYSQDDFRGSEKIEEKSFNSRTLTLAAKHDKRGNNTVP